MAKTRRSRPVSSKTASRRRAAAAASAPELNYALASQWWPDLDKHNTSLGWKDHLFRFNVFFNGTVLCWPDANRRCTKWKDQGAHVRFLPGGLARGFYGQFDDHLVRQGWADHVAPVLWSRVPCQGLEFEQQVFAHVHGGGETRTGIEPLFAWVRWRVIDRLEVVKVGEGPHGRTSVAVLINKPYAWSSMTAGHNLLYDFMISRYPRPLTPQAPDYDPGQGWRLLEPEGMVRFAFAPGADCTIEVIDGKPLDQDYQIKAWIQPQVGATLDMLLPMVPTDRATFDAELARGFEGALAEANRFWAPRSASAATVSIPEKPLTQVLEVHVKNAQVVAEIDPESGDRSTVTGTWSYANLWPTPNSMTLTCLLDPLGHHEVAERYMELFRRHQGSIKPPGDSFQDWSGYYASPKSLTSIDWLSDHGAILYSVANHALLRGDEAFIGRWIESLLRACDFIKTSLAIKGHGGIEGILPPAVATDRGTKIQGVWNDGWNYRGLRAAARLLDRLGHPRAREFADEADEYRSIFVAALRDITARQPTWTDSRGRKRHFVPPAFSGDIAEESRQGFYLDTGPLFLVYAGLLDADDPLMADTRAWFREGPPHRQYRRESSCWQVPVLVHEMSSCEPCYSWVGFHSWQLGDRARFLEAMYSLFVGSMSRQTFTMCETRNGITGLTSALPQALMARLAVIDDQIRENELHLLRLVPLAWLSPRERLSMQNMPTEFGPVSIEAGLTRDGKALDVRFEPRYRHAPGKVVLHVPPVPGLARVRINGKTATPKAGKVTLAQAQG